MAAGFCEFAAWIAGKIRADSGVVAFCASKAWPLPSFMVGEDRRETIDTAGEFPRIIINCGGRGLSRDGHRLGFQAMLGICTKIEAEATTEGAITTYPGYAVAEEFGKAVMKAISNAGLHSTRDYAYGHAQPGQADDLQQPYIRQWLAVSVEHDSEFHT